MKVDMDNVTPTFLAAYPNRSVEENWSSFKEHLSQLMSICLHGYIPCKTTSKRQNLPWMSAEHRRKSRRKHRLYSKAKSSNDPGSWSTFKQFKKSTAIEQLTENPLAKLVLHLEYLTGPFLVHCSFYFSSMTFPMWCHLVQPLVSLPMIVSSTERSRVAKTKLHCNEIYQRLSPGQKYGVCRSTQ